MGPGMGPGMMGYYSPEQYEKQYKEFQNFLDDTRDLRKKMHTLKFDFSEAQRNPDTKQEDLEKMNTEMESIWKQLDEKKKSVFK
jgi:peptidoglycan hydrolase CwlO-like protein